MVDSRYLKRPCKIDPKQGRTWNNACLYTTPCKLPPILLNGNNSGAMLNRTARGRSAKKQGHLQDPKSAYGATNTRCATPHEAFALIHVTRARGLPSFGACSFPSLRLGHPSIRCRQSRSAQVLASRSIRLEVYWLIASATVTIA